MRKLLVPLVCIGLAACGGGDEGTIETEDGEITYSVDGGDGEVNATFRGENGEEMTIQSGQGADVDLPDGFVLYPGATVVSNTTVQTGDGGGSMIMIESSDSADEVAAFYQEQAEADGIEIKMEMKSGDARIVSGEGPNGEVFSVNAFAGDEGGSTAQITMGTKVE